jgi:hypothetical protein
MSPTLKEGQIVLALQALQNDKNLSVRAAAKIYRVARKTLVRRRASKLTRCDTTPKVKKLTQLEEEAIIRYIVELYTRAFPLRLSGKEDMAN